MSEDPYSIPANDGAPVPGDAQLPSHSGPPVTGRPLAEPGYAPVAEPSYPPVAGHTSSQSDYAAATQPGFASRAETGQALTPQQGYGPSAELAYGPGGFGRVPVARGVLMKRRNPFAVWLGLPLVTLGIYSLVWYYKIHHEMGEFDRRRNIPDIGPVLVLIFLGWTLIAPLVSLYNCGDRIANAQRAAGLRASCSPGLGVLLMFAFGLGIFYYQVELNRVHDVYGQHAEPGTDIPLFA